MSLYKKLTSSVLSMCLALSAAAVGGTALSAPVSAAPANGALATSSLTTTGTPAENAAANGLMPTCQEGVILHAWQWSFNNIKANMAAIAEAGYTSVQTSVIQQSKDATAGATNEVWWVYYQPANFTIDNTGNSALGTKAEFQAMCAEAHKYGIHVIVDVVSNHLGNETGYDIYHGIPDDLKIDQYPECWHANWNVSIKSGGNGYNDRNRSINYSLDGLPDLNTENSKVQAYVLNYLKECIDAGADGFRFDTAKHIGTRADNTILNDGVDYSFWDNVIPPAKAYYANNQNKAFDSLYCYGEFLGSTGESHNSQVINSLLENINLTDDVTGYYVREGVRTQNASGAASSSYNKADATADRLVLWAESHDTYSNEDKQTTNISTSVINKTWALVASRSGATALYFARTDGYRGGYIGEIYSRECFKPEVAEVNKFHNIFNGKTEYLAYSDKTVYNERGTKGVVISKLDGGGSVSLTAHRMADGTYTDHVSNNTFTVSNGVISGTVGSTGIAVVYNADDVNEPEFTANKFYLVPGKWDKDGATFRVCLYNSNTKAEETIDMTASPEAGIFQAVPVNKTWTKISFQRISEDGTTVWNHTSDLFPSNGNNRYTVSSTITSWNGEIGDWDSYTICDHVYNSAPVWSWTGTTSATATFKCSVCLGEQTINATISRSEGTSTVTYTATVVFNGQTYTNSKSVENTGNAVLYLVPSEYWKEASAEFALYTYSSTGASDPAWTSMTKNSNDLYFAEVPDKKHNKVIFVRMNPSRTENRWNNSGEAGSVKPVWGQTTSQTIPTNGNNCFTVNENVWDQVGGTWSKYTPSPVFTDGIGASLAGYTLSLEGDIGVNFYMELAPEIASSNNAYMEFTVPHSGQTSTLMVYVNQQNDETLPYAKTATIDGKTYYIFKCSVAAKEMTQQIKAQMNDGSGNKGTLYSYSVEDYAKDLITNAAAMDAATNSTAYSSAVPLVKAMLNYGAYTQIFFEYEGTLANASLTEQEKTLGNVVIPNPDYSSANLPTGVSFIGSTLMLKSETILMLYFESNNDLTFACGDYDVVSSGSEGYKIAQIVGISAKDLLNSFTLTVNGTGTVVYSPMNYCYNVLNSTTTSSDLKNVIKALYLYSQAAQNYLNSNA